MNPRDINKNQNQNIQNNPVDNSNRDRVVMQNGKMIKVKNGQLTILQENEMTVSNGTKIMSDGTCIKKDGTKITMKNGQHMDMSGDLIPMQTDRDRNMYLVPGSIIRKDFLKPDNIHCSIINEEIHNLNLYYKITE
jgi:hypothetical protein